MTDEEKIIALETYRKGFKVSDDELDALIELHKEAGRLVRILGPDFGIASRAISGDLEALQRMKQSRGSHRDNLD